MSDLQWQPESPFTELEGEGDAGYGEYEAEYEFEYEDETRAPISALARVPLRVAQGAPVPTGQTQSAQSAASGAPRIGSTAKVIPGLIFVKIEGTKSGVFPGNVTQKGREGSIAASGFAHEVKSPRDVSSGQATGKRQHTPVTLTLPWSSASPLLFNALVANEVLKSVVIEFVAAQASGAEVLAQRVTLTNATVADLRRVNDRTQVNQGGPVDVVAFAYQKIAIDDLLGGQAAVDDWMAAVAELELEFEDAGPIPEAEEWLGETYQLEDTGAGEYGPDGSYN
jgi:type VI secretion system secreted protein Hcp